MSFDSRKSLRGQELVEEITILFNGCKYAQNHLSTNNRAIRNGGTAIPANLSGLNVTVNSGAWFSAWSSYPSASLYAQVGGGEEIIKCEIINSTTLFISGRGQFGTPSSIIPSASSFRLMHKGEADGSCRGYSQTCSDSDSYAAGVFRSVRLCTAPLSAGAKAVPGLHHQKIDYDSAEIEAGESIGSPARLKFSLQDITGRDELAVPYLNRRSSEGTFWGRMLARNPYVTGRKVIYRAGLRDAGSFSEPDYVERHFIIDSVSLADGMVNFSCLDPIILTEDKKSKIPVVSPAQLSANITGSPATFSYINAPDYYFGSSGATVFVRIDSEVIRATVSGAKQLTVSQRGYRSLASDHQSGATIQDCIRFAGTHVIDAIVYALQNFTKMPSSYIGDYSAVKALIPSIDMDEAIISKPMPVAEFISTMIKLGNLIFYFDESSLKIVIDYIPELSISPININETQHIKRGTVSVDGNIKEQWTRFAHLWAPVDVTKEDDTNYSINYLAANASVESPAKMGEINEKKTFKNHFLTNSPGDSLIGAAYCSRVVSGADRAPKIVNAVVNTENIGITQGGNLKLGSIINLITRDNQGIDGLPRAELFQVLKISGNPYKDYSLKMRRYLAFQPGQIDFVIVSGAVNYSLSNHFAPPPGNYNIYIEPGVEFGSYLTNVPAFTTGTQASGVSFNIIHRGAILGQGGAGGNAQLTSGGLYPQGGEGGIAFEATVPCVIDCGAGLIWAGGGGARGEFYIPPQGPGGSHKVARRGGGGGQGYGTSLGGFNSDGDGNQTDRAESGNRSAPGTYLCPDGGEWGKNGKTGSGSLLDDGGLAGIAIKSNGNPVTITAGNNDFNIRGRRT